MSAKKKHTLFELAGAGIAAFVGYEYVYKPWKIHQDAAAAGIVTPSGSSSFFAPPSSMVSAPTTTAANIGATIGDHRITPGGPTGYAMWLKNWSQVQAHDRLTKEQTAYNNAQAAILALKTSVNNPAAAGIPAAQAELAKNEAALAGAQLSYQALSAAGNTAGAAQFAASIAGLQQNISELKTRISQAGTTLDNSAAIATWESAAATNASQFASLTGGMPVTTPVN